jgi:large subunit ribosomal protein L22
MQVRAQLKSLRISPRKVRLVSRVIKGMDATVGAFQLEHVIKRTSKPMLKLLNSALANAKNNFKLAKENLYIKDVIVDEGIKLKRFRPKGFGMASPIEKKTSHITIVLEEKVPGMKSNEIKEEKIEKVDRVEKAEIKSKTSAKPEVKKEIKKKGLLGGIGRKFFRRKAI